MLFSQCVLVLLGRVAERTVQPYGIEFETLTYNCNELGLLRDQLEGQKVRIKYHPGDISRLYVYDPFGQRYLEVPAVDPQGYTQGLSLWKHRFICKQVRENQDEVDALALATAKRKLRAKAEAGKIRKTQAARLLNTTSSVKANQPGTSPGSNTQDDTGDSQSMLFTSEDDALLPPDDISDWGVDFARNH